MTGSDYCFFKSKKLDYNPNNYRSLSTLLGFMDAKNVALLWAAVSKHYPNIFPNQQKLINATKTEKLLHVNLKRKTDQIKQLEGELKKTNINEENLLELNVKNAIKSAKLGSTILISKEQYFSLVLMQPCHIAGISYNAVQCLLAIIGVTNQICSRTYHYYQKIYFSSFRTCATSSTKNALKKCIEHILSKGNKTLALGFDCLWSHAILINIQIEHVILIKVLNQISPLLEEASLYLEICIDGDLDSNKTLANVPIVSNIYANLKHLTKNIRNSLYNKKYTRFYAFEDHIMHWFHEYIYLAALQNRKPFETKDLYNINAIEKECSEKQRWNVNKIQQHNQIRANNFANKYKELGSFNFDQKLVPCKFKAQNWLHSNMFYLSFASLIIDFDITIGCIGCHTFSKYTKGLYALCYIYQVFGWKNRILNPEEIKDDIYESMNLIQQIEVITEKIFQYTNLRSGQLEAIESYIGDKKDTLVILKTGGGNYFCYAAFTILFDGFTIVISSLKSLIQNQINHFVQLEVPCSGLLTSSKGTIEYETKLFDEIVLGFTCLLYIATEKLLLNKSVWRLYNYLYDIRKLQLVIDEAHCIFDFCHFREEWKKLEILKQYFPNAQIMALTATLYYADIKALQINLNFDSTHFATIRGSNLFHKELCFLVQS
ncbi:17600_t:CDS:2 [Gigaspora margarita]|uniref:17600_t:CDS:1 n=1 Tax=Gigaspora margarita TaxID=4874 RepID=A0ABN7U0M8_GIGMA|nr:17600_t:CDS:2 [Gigaspora margarita]